MGDVVWTEYSIDPVWVFVAFVASFVVVTTLLVRAVVRARGRWWVGLLAALALAGMVWLAFDPVTIQRNGYPSSCSIYDAVASGFEGPGNEKELAQCRTAARRSLALFFAAAGSVALAALVIPRRHR